MKKLFILFFCGFLTMTGCQKDDPKYGGKIGNLSWMLYNDGTFIVNGTGEIPDYWIFPTENLPPWYEYREEILKVSIGNNISKVGSFAFFRSENLTSVTFGKSVSAIGFRAFSGCSSLKSVVIPDLVTVIEDDSFSGCSDLASVTIPNSVTVIEYASFYQCESLASIVIPNSVTTIGESAFLGCNNLISATIGSSVTTIEDDAFRNCGSLKEIINHQEVPQIIGRWVLGGVSKVNCRLFVPAKSVDAYRLSDVWKEFVHIQAIN